MKDFYERQKQLNNSFNSSLRHENEALDSTYDVVYILKYSFFSFKIIFLKIGRTNILNNNFTLNPIKTKEKIGTLLTRTANEHFKTR